VPGEHEGTVSLSRTRTVAAIVVVLPWVAWAVMRNLGLERAHPLTAAIAFTPYVAATAWVPVLVAAALRRWWVAAVALIAAVGLVVAVAPRALGGGRTVAGASGRPVTVMTSNLAYGHGDPHAIMSLVRRHHVDVLSLQELTPEAVRALDDAGARAHFSYRVLHADTGARGSGLMSRYPLRPRRFAPRDQLTTASAVLIVPGAKPTRTVAVHPPPPLGADVGDWRRQLRGLSKVPAHGTSTLLIGDFNATLDHRELRTLLNHGLVDAADTTGAGLRTTYSTRQRFPPPITIDHVLVDGFTGVGNLTVHTVPGSDHRALLATITLPAR